jgi:hypothetical protein
MVLDIFDPGPLADFPNFPRNPDGTPAWSDTPDADGKRVNGVVPVPRGLRPQDGRWLDLTPYNPDGTPISPPTRLP